VGQSFTSSFKNIKSIVFSAKNVINLWQVTVAQPVSKRCTASAVGHFSIYILRNIHRIYGPANFYTECNKKLLNLQFVGSVCPVSRDVCNVLGSESGICSSCFVAPSVRKNMSAVKVSFANLFVHRLIAKVVS
jgi:hypothetical protein